MTITFEVSGRVDRTIRELVKSTNAGNRRQVRLFKETLDNLIRMDRAEGALTAREAAALRREYL